MIPRARRPRRPHRLGIADRIIGAHSTGPSVVPGISDHAIPRSRLRMRRSRAPPGGRTRGPAVATDERPDAVADSAVSIVSGGATSVWPRPDPPGGGESTACSASPVACSRWVVRDNHPFGVILLLQHRPVGATSSRRRGGRGC